MEAVLKKKIATIVKTVKKTVFKTIAIGERWAQLQIQQGQVEIYSQEEA